jgi:hypothetical protein
LYTIPAGSTLQGKAGSATTISYSIFGLERDTSGPSPVGTYTKLAQGQLGTSVGVLYTAPAATSAFVKSIHLVNTNTSTAITAQLYVDGSDNAHAITPAITIPKGGWADYVDDGWHVYDANGNLQTSSGTGAPTNASYITTVSEAGLSSEHVLGSDVIKTGTTASLPGAPDYDGQIYRATDAPFQIWRGNSGAWVEIARGEAGLRLASLGEKLHASLASVGTDDHHNKSHVHLSDGSGTVAHTSLSTVGVDDHHAKSHGHTGGDGSGTVDHANLTNVTAAQHHSNANDPTSDQKAALAGTDGTPSVTDKYVTDSDARNSNARTPSAHHVSHEVGGGDAMAITHAQTTGQTANDHHNQAHVISGADHTGTLPHTSLSSVGVDDHHNKSHVHTADGSGTVAHTSLSTVGADDHHNKSHVHTGDGSGTVAHSSLSGIGANDHHAQSHDHSAAGDGTALAPATFTFPAASGPAQTAEAVAVWDSDDDILTVGTGAARKNLMEPLSGTFALRPAASATYRGMYYFATDCLGGTTYFCDGTNWLLVNCNGKSNTTTTTFTGTGQAGATEVQVGPAWTIKANSLVAGSILEWKFGLHFGMLNSATARTFTFRLRWGGTSGTIILNSSAIALTASAADDHSSAAFGVIAVRTGGATGVLSQEFAVLNNRWANTANDKVNAFGGPSTSGAINPIDFTADKDFVLTVAESVNSVADVVKFEYGFVRQVA